MKGFANRIKIGNVKGSRKKLSPIDLYGNITLAGSGYYNIVG